MAPGAIGAKNAPHNRRTVNSTPRRQCVTYPPAESRLTYRPGRAPSMSGRAERTWERRRLTRQHALRRTGPGTHGPTGSPQRKRSISTAMTRRDRRPDRECREIERRSLLEPRARSPGPPSCLGSPVAWCGRTSGAARGKWLPEVVRADSGAVVRRRHKCSFACEIHIRHAAAACFRSLHRPGDGIILLKTLCRYRYDQALWRVMPSGNSGPEG